MKPEIMNPHAFPFRRAALATALFALTVPAAAGNRLDTLLDMDPGALGAVNVSTASREAETHARAPGGIVVVSRTTIRERGYRHLGELLADLPAIDMHLLSDGSTNNRVATRGVVGNNKLLILRDGVRISAPAGDPIAILDNFPLYFVRQVEVVYGPASALYGADAFTGVVNLITDTDLASGSEIQLEAGEHGHRYGHLNLVRPLGGSARLQIGGHWRETDHADLSRFYPREFSGVRDGDRYRQPTASQSLNARLDIGDRFSFGWNHGLYNSRTSISANPAIVRYDADAEYITRLDTAWAEWRWRADDRWSGRVVFDWSLHKVDPDSQFVNLYTNFQSQGWKYARNERLRVEPQLTWSGDGQRLVAGLSLESIDARPKTANLPRRYDGPGAYYYPATDDNLEIEFFRQRYRNTGAFFQYSREIGEDLLLHAGARHDHNSVYGDSLTPRLGANYSLSSGTVIKYLYGKAFLAPSPFLAYENYGSFYKDGDQYKSWYFHVPNPGLDPEHLDSHELRLTHSPSADLELSLGLWRVRAHDIIYRMNSSPTRVDFVPGGTIAFTTENTNIGSLSARGLDAGFDLTRPLAGAGSLRWWGNLTLTDGTLRREDLTLPLPFVSRFKANLGLTWTHGDFQLSPSLRHVGRAQEAADNGRSSVSGYTVANLHARWLNVADRLDLHLRVNNLFDRRYYNVGDGGAGGFAGTPQEPRSIWLGATIPF